MSLDLGITITDPVFERIPNTLYSYSVKTAGSSTLTYSNEASDMLFEVSGYTSYDGEELGPEFDAPYVRLFSNTSTYSACTPDMVFTHPLYNAWYPGQLTLSEDMIV